MLLQQHGSGEPHPCKALRKAITKAIKRQIKQLKAQQQAVGEEAAKHDKQQQSMPLRQRGATGQVGGEGAGSRGSGAFKGMAGPAAAPPPSSTATAAAERELLRLQLLLAQESRRMQLGFMPPSALA
eukprot:scaffold126838_cov22-Tisochrysis_lutea.AAC.1